MSMTKSNIQTIVRLGPQGRIVIPTKLRQMLAVQPGDTLIARCRDGQLVLEKAETLKRRLKARFAHIPKQTSLAQELLKERREEAKREAGR